jgi:hypothetical protein
MTFSLKLRLVWLASGSRASSSWFVIANELKSWLGSVRYHNELSRASHESSELTSFEFFVHPYSYMKGSFYAGQLRRNYSYMKGTFYAGQLNKRNKEYYSYIAEQLAQW